VGIGISWSELAYAAVIVPLGRYARDGEAVAAAVERIVEAARRSAVEAQQQQQQQCRRAHLKSAYDEHPSD
jgi:hypothetical protein